MAVIVAMLPVRLRDNDINLSRGDYGVDTGI